MRSVDPGVRISSRFRALAAAGLDQRSVKVALLDEIRRLVPFDAYVWVSTDPESEVGSSPVADVPFSPWDLPRLIRLKYGTATNRWTHLVEPASSLAMATGGNLAESLVWRELLSDHGVIDIAGVVFRDSFGCWGFLDLWRMPPHSPFSEEEVAILARVAEPLTAALRGALASTFDETVRRTDRVGPIVLMLSPDLVVNAQTPETPSYLRWLLPDDSVPAPVPAGAYNVAAQLLAREAGVDDHPPWARVHVSGGPWLTLRASRIGLSADDVLAAVAVSVEPSAPLERLSLFVRVFGLTPREAELVGHLRDGGDTRQVAERMFLGELTVQDHLKSIFRKTGTHSRRELLARGLGQ
ncbi:MAG: helix-turn-helix transcriptional regulator [Acidimicrobiia bacterium]